LILAVFRESMELMQRRKERLLWLARANCSGLKSAIHLNQA
jgi:hypothetical protein